MKNIIKQILREEERKQNVFVPHNVDTRIELKYNKIKTLLNQKIINGGLDLENLYLVRDLGEVEVVKGMLDLMGTGISDLGNLKEVHGSCFLNKLNIRSLGKLEYVYGDLNCNDCVTLEDLGNLEVVEESLILDNTNVSVLGNLQYIGAGLFIKNTPLEKMYTDEQIRNQIDIKGKIYRSTR